MDTPSPARALILLTLAVLLVYANSLNVDFVYDDYAFVLNNREIRTFTPFSKFFLSPEAFSNPVSYHVYRPLATLTFAINYALHGLHPAGYHAANLFFHTLNAFLVLVLLRRIGFSENPAFAGALVFAIHPVHIEAVTWISGRGNVLFLFFFLLSYLFYVKAGSLSNGRKIVFLFTAAIAYGLSLLAKEMAFPLPVLLFGHDLYFRREWSRKERVSRLVYYLPFAIIALGYFVLRSSVLGRIGQVTYHGGSIYVTFLLMLKAFATYVRLLFVPVELSLSRHFQPHRSILEPEIVASFCIALFAGILCFFTFRRHRRLSFSIYWFAITLLPVSNIIPVNAIVADRFLYGPSIAFCILMACWISTLWRKPGLKRALIAGQVGVFFVFGILSVGRNNDWRNTFVLWSKTAENSPTSFVAFNNLGLEYMKRGQFAEAEKALKNALEIKADLPETHINLARINVQMNRFDMARHHYEAALSHGETTPDVHYELGALREQMGNASDALYHYQKAVEQRPDLVEAHRRLAALYETRDTDQAINHLKMVLSLKPDDADAHYRLGMLYYRVGNFQEARDALQKTLSLNPGKTHARNLLEKVEDRSNSGKISD